MVAQFCRAEHALIARTLALCVGTHAVRAAEVELLRAVKIAARLLPRHLHEEIRRVPNLLHGRQVSLEFCIRALVNIVDHAEHRAVERIIAQPAERQIRTVVKTQPARLLRTDQPRVDAVRMLLSLEVKRRNVVLQIAVVVPVAQGETAVRLMENRHAAEDRHRRRLALGADLRELSADLVVHA